MQYIALLTLFIPCTLLAGEKIAQPDTCPTNAYCQPLASAEYAPWGALFARLKKNSHDSIAEIARTTQKSGLPFPVWGNESSRKNPHAIFWESHCALQRKMENKIYIGHLMAKKLPATNADIILDHALELLPGGKIKKYIVPREEFPSWVEKDSFYFLREEEGIFYGLFISAKGNFHIQPVIKGDHPPEKLLCPPELLEAFQAQNNKGLIPYCKQIWDRKSGVWRSFLFGESC